MLRNNSLTISGLLLSAIVLFSMGVSTVYAAFSLSDWKYVKPIIIPASLKEADLIEFSPDDEVFGGAASGLADLRIVTASITEVPYKLEVKVAEKKRTPIAVTLRDKGYVAGAYTTFIADLGRAGILHNEIEFQSPTDNFRRTAVVETSNNRQTWMKVAEQTVYDFTVKERNFTTSDTAIRYPESTARYLRVKIDDEEGMPVEITRATLFYVEETAADETSRRVTVQDVVQDREKGITTVDLDTGAAGIPSHRLAVRTADVNFHRQVTIQASRDRKSWRTIQSNSEIYAYETPKFTGKNLVINYPESTLRYLRIIIHDQDSPPLGIDGIDLWSLRRRIVFRAEPPQSYFLYYGNPDARRPSYDIEKIFPYLETENLVDARLGTQADNPDFIEKEPPVTERFPWLLPLVIALAVTVVALILLGITRQAKKVLTPPPE